MTTRERIIALFGGFVLGSLPCLIVIPGLWFFGRLEPQPPAVERDVAESRGVAVETWSGAEARRRTLRNVHELDTAEILTHINRRIRLAVSEGKWSVIDPLAGLPRQVDIETAEAVRSHYDGIGYRYETVPDPDPCDGRGRPYDLLSWNDGREPIE